MRSCALCLCAHHSHKNHNYVHRPAYRTAAHATAPAQAHAARAERAANPSARPHHRAAAATRGVHCTSVHTHSAMRWPATTAAAAVQLLCAAFLHRAIANSRYCTELPFSVQLRCDISVRIFCWARARVLLAHARANVLRSQGRAGR